jgi:tryptophan-rich sensory protein
MSELIQYIPIIIPGLLGFISAMFCNVKKDSGSNVSFRPPTIAFSIVWPILYILLGLSWFYSRKENQIISDIFYISLILVLCLWIFVYSCQNNKKSGVYILIISIIFALLSYTIAPLNSKIMIVPLIGWLFFATLLNMFEVK